MWPIWKNIQFEVINLIFRRNFSFVKIFLCPQKHRMKILKKNFESCWSSKICEIFILFLYVITSRTFLFYHWNTNWHARREKIEEIKNLRVNKSESWRKKGIFWAQKSFFFHSKISMNVNNNNKQTKIKALWRKKIFELQKSTLKARKFFFFLFSFLCFKKKTFKQNSEEKKNYLKKIMKILF